MTARLCLAACAALLLSAIFLSPPASRAASPVVPLPPPIDGMIDVVLGVPPNLSSGDSLDAAPAPRVRPARPNTPRNILPVFLGIPYRPDGVINDGGKYALFNRPDAPLPTPGLNCSGLVLAASRILLARNISVADAIRDRENDSGPGSPGGRDWDFGFDLIMNIGESVPHALLVPPGVSVTEKITGKTAPSFDPHSPGFTAALLPKIKEERLYLVSFSRHKTPESPPYLHYHTGIIARDGQAVWLYSTTRDSGKVIRRNLASAEGLAGFRASFKNAAASYKRLTVVELVVEAR